MAVCTPFATEIHIILFIPTWVNATILSRDSHALDATSYLPCTPFSLMLARRGWSTVMISFQIWSKTRLHTASRTQALGVTGGRPWEPRSLDLCLVLAGPSSLQ